MFNVAGNTWTGLLTSHFAFTQRFSPSPLAAKFLCSRGQADTARVRSLSIQTVNVLTYSYCFSSSTCGRSSSILSKNSSSRRWDLFVHTHESGARRPALIGSGVRRVNASYETSLTQPAVVFASRVLGTAAANGLAWVGDTKPTLSDAIAVAGLADTLPFISLGSFCNEFNVFCITFLFAID